MTTRMMSRSTPERNPNPGPTLPTLLRRVKRYSQYSREDQGDTVGDCVGLEVMVSQVDMSEVAGLAETRLQFEGAVISSGTVSLVIIAVKDTHDRDEPNIILKNASIWAVSLPSILSTSDYRV